MYTQSLNSGGRAAQRLNQHFYFIRFLHGDEVMKKINAKVAMPVNVIVNTMDKSRDRWAQIQNGTTGEVLHTGQPSYIRRVAKARYNASAKI
jgi:hypothetical protein